MNRITALCLVSVCGLSLSGCGDFSKPDCSNLQLGVLPATGTRDHAAGPPQNQLQFEYTYINLPSGCNVPTPAFQVDWSVSDTTDVQIDTNGVATCLNAAANPSDRNRYIERKDVDRQIDQPITTG
jgi:hypothetical protein